jgi:hypothetical protein
MLLANQQLTQAPGHCHYAESKTRAKSGINDLTVRSSQCRYKITEFFRRWLLPDLGTLKMRTISLAVSGALRLTTATKPVANSTNTTAGDAQAQMGSFSQ